MAQAINLDELFSTTPVTSKPKRQESAPLDIDNLFPQQGKESGEGRGIAREALRQAGGVAASAGDLIGSIPGFLAGTGKGLYDVATGKPATEALEGAKKMMNDLNPMNLLSETEDLRTTAGYKYSPSTLLMDVATKSLEGYNQGAQALTHMATGSHGKARELGAATELGLMAALPFARGRAAPAGSPQAYQGVQGMKPGAADIRQAQEAQPTYATDRIRAQMQPEQPAAGQQAGPPAYSRSGQLPNIETPTQFLERTGREAEMKRAQEMARGEVKEGLDSQNFLREQETGTKDMFDPALQTKADREIASGMQEGPARQGMDIPGSEFKQFTKEFHKDPGATERTAPLFDQRNPELFKEPAVTPRGLDYWKSRLDDTVSRVDQIIADKFVQNYDKHIQTKAAELKHLSEQLRLAESEGLYTKNGQLRTGKDATKTIEELRRAVGETLGEMRRAEVALEKRMMSPRWHMREIHPDRAYTGDRASSAPENGLSLKERPGDAPAPPTVDFKGPDAITQNRLRQWRIAKAKGQAGGLDFSRDEVGRLFSTDPARAAKELAKRSSSPEAFAKEYEKYTGDAAGGRSLYAWAKQEAAKDKGETLRPQGATKSESVSSQTPEAPKGKGWSPKLSEYLGWDRRPPEEVRQSLLDGARDGTIKDIMFEKPHLQGQAWGRDHPLMHYAQSKVDWAERQVNYTASKYLWGHKFSEKNVGIELKPFKVNLSSLRKARREADPESAMYGWMKLKDPDKKPVLNALVEFDRQAINPTDAMLQGKGLTPAQIIAYKNMRGAAERFWKEEVIPAHERMRQIDPNIKPLPPMREGWIPHSWHGEYRIYGKNAKTGQEYMIGADNLWQAKRAIPELKKQFPDVEFKPQDISHVSKEHYAKSADAFIDAVKIMGNNSAEGQALMAAFDKFMARRSKFSVHKMPRHETPIEGYAGSYEQGNVHRPGKHFGRDKALVNFERSIESYFNAGSRYLHNKQMLQEMEKVTKSEPIMSEFPNATGAVNRMLESYFGADKFIDPLLKGVSQTMGLNSHAVKDVIQSGASYVMYTKVMGLRVGFYIAQALQPAFIEPKMMQLKDMGLSEGSIHIAGMKAFMDWAFDYGKRGELAKWAQEQGIIEPRFSEQILLAPDFHGGKSNVKDKINTLTGNRLSAAIDMSTRWYALLAFVNMMEANGIKGKAAWEAAARPSLDVMVEYEHWKRSPAFREMGQVGHAFSQLTTYLNNSLNRMGEYTMENRKSLAAMLALYFTFSGLTGIPFRQDVDNAIDALNRDNGSDFPNITDTIIKHSDKIPSKFAQDYLLYGLPSAVSEYNIGGSLGSPEILGSLLPSPTDPVIETGVGAVRGAMALGKDSLFSLTGGAAGRPVTDEERVAGLKAVLPTAPGHGLVENARSVDTQHQGLSGMLPQNRNIAVPDSKLNFKWERTPEEQTARLFGLKSTDEALSDTRHFRSKVDETKDKEFRARLVKVAVDHLIRGKGIPPKLLEKYMERGGDPDEWDRSLDREEKERTESRKDRMLDKADRSDRVDDIVRKHGLDRQERRK